MPPTTSLGIRYPVLSDTANVPRDVGYTSADIDALLVAERAAWTAYTPTLTAATTNPTLGSGSVTGAYRQRGKTVQGRVRVAFGTSFTAGSGTYYISLPATPAAAHANLSAIGTATAGDASGNVRPYLAMFHSGSGKIILQNTSAYSLLDHTGPTAAWTSTGYITLTYTYESA